MNIRVHKKVNSNHITLGKESLINTFYGLVELYNKQDTYKDLELTKQSLWELAGYQGSYDSNYIRELTKELSKASTFEPVNIEKLGIGDIESVDGSMFVITTYKDGTLKVEVPKAYRRLLFYKKDLDLMTKAKKKLKMSTEELDHWDRETREKSKFLVLLKKADLLHIQGKYNKRLYALLMQWSYTGSYEVKYQDFKEILEIPKSYRASDIDKQVLTPSKKELLKVGVKITRVTKKKEGRSITGIKINFKLVDIEEEVQTKQSQGTKAKPKKAESLKTDVRESKMTEVEKLKADIIKLEIPMKKRTELLSKVADLETVEEVTKVIEKYL